MKTIEQTMDELYPQPTRADRLTSALCAEIDWLEHELKKAQADAEYWKKQHGELIQRDLTHGQRMMMGLLGVAIGTVPSPDPKARELGASLAHQAAQPLSEPERDPGAHGELTEEQLQDETQYLAEKDPATYQEIFHRPPD